MLDPPGKPTPRLRARVLREEIESRRHPLQVLERELKRGPVQDINERVRVDQVTVAIEHLELAIDALDLASQEKVRGTLMPHDWRPPTDDDCVACTRSCATCSSTSR